MLLGITVLLLATVGLAGCNFTNPVREYECRPRPGEPNCNGDLRIDECAAIPGMPTDYGVDNGCKHPVRPIDGDCVRRPQGIYRCVEANDLLCCYR